MSDAPRAIRPPAVAGLFYPEDPRRLTEVVQRALAGAVAPAPGAPAPKAIVVPHAGYRYSGAVAASAYRRVSPAGHAIGRVVLLGPSHRVHLSGLAVAAADAFETPLGVVPVDAGLRARVAGLDGVVIDDAPHRHEHSLEVQLPFLQTVLDDFTLLPLSVGAATTGQVAAVLAAVWGDAGTLIVISTDLSHYHRYEDAERLDARTAAAIVARRCDQIGDHDACGSRPLRGILRAAIDHDLTVEQLDLRNSGDTAGDRDRVVGYGAFALA